MYIKISEDFSDAVVGRYIKEGPFSGEEFRDNMLIPKYKESLLKNEKLSIDFDGGWGYAPGFLEESFGGMVRLGYDVDEIFRTIEFISKEDPKLIDEIKQYILESKEIGLKHKLY